MRGGLHSLGVLVPRISGIHGGNPSHTSLRSTTIYESIRVIATNFFKNKEYLRRLKSPSSKRLCLLSIWLDVLLHRRSLFEQFVMLFIFRISFSQPTGNSFLPPQNNKSYNGSYLPGWAYLGRKRIRT